MSTMSGPDYASEDTCLEHQETCIRAHFVQLVDNVEPVDVADNLYQLEVLTLTQHEAVTNRQRPARDRAREMLGIVTVRRQGIHALVLAMTQHRVHALLAHRLWRMYRDRVRVGGMEQPVTIMSHTVNTSSQISIPSSENEQPPGSSRDQSEALSSLNLTLHDTGGQMDRVVDEKVRQRMSQHQALQQSLPSVIHQHLQSDSALGSAKHLPVPGHVATSGPRNIPLTSASPTESGYLSTSWPGQASATALAPPGPRSAYHSGPGNMSMSGTLFAGPGHAISAQGTTAMSGHTPVVVSGHTPVVGPRITSVPQVGVVSTVAHGHFAVPGHTVVSGPGPPDAHTASTGGLEKGPAPSFTSLNSNHPREDYAKLNGSASLRHDVLYNGGVASQDALRNRLNAESIHQNIGHSQQYNNHANHLHTSSTGLPLQPAGFRYRSFSLESTDSSNDETEIETEDDVSLFSFEEYAPGSCGREQTVTAPSSRSITKLQAVRVGDNQLVAINPLPPPANTYHSQRQRRFHAFVFNQLVLKINNCQYGDYYDLSRQFVLSNPHDKDLHFIILSAEAAACLFQNDSNKGLELLNRAGGELSGTSQPTAFLLDILAKRAWLEQQDRSLAQLDCTTQQAMQLIHTDPSTSGTAAGWVYFNRGRYISAMASTASDSDKIRRMNQLAVTHLERAIDHFRQPDGGGEQSEGGEVGALTSLTAMAMVLLGCGERLATVQGYTPPPEDIKRARALISQVQDAAAVAASLDTYVQLALCDYHLRLGCQHTPQAQRHAQAASDLATSLGLQEPLTMAQLRLLYSKSPATACPQPQQGACQPRTSQTSSKQDKYKDICPPGTIPASECVESSKLTLSSHTLKMHSRSVKVEVDLARFAQNAQPKLRMLLVCVLVAAMATLLHQYCVC